MEKLETDAMHSIVHIAQPRITGNNLLLCSVDANLLGPFSKGTLFKRVRKVEGLEGGKDPTITLGC